MRLASRYLKFPTAVRLMLFSIVLASPSLPAQDAPPPGTAVTGEGDLKKQVNDLRALVEALQARVAQLEKGTPASLSASPQAVVAAPPSAPAPVPPPAAPVTSGLLPDTTINFLLDGYYGINSNRPIGRVNLLRAYDISSNAFSLNQAALIIENVPDPARGKRFGLRLDLQFGQATETLQGNPLNEPRPDIYRNIFQAYGTYVLPIDKGLTVDFGKFASSLGYEGNYTKDQANYSRSYLFAYLPFYHMGARVNYKITDRIAFNYWITNGTQQTEPFNGFKDEFFGLTLQPVKNLSWNVNYYLGQEHPDVTFYPTQAPPGLPTEQGLPFSPIVHPPTGRLHIFDTYASWQPNERWSFTGEVDYVVQRLLRTSQPQHTIGGALYAGYRLNSKWALAARGEYISDRGGLFSGFDQALRETTFTADYKVADGFLLRGEWRRDFSNHPYFLTDTLGVLKKEQNTSTLGLVWWFGQKQGAW